MTNDVQSVLDTLFYPFQSGVLSCPPESRVLFLNAHMHEGLQAMAEAQLTLHQYFMPEAIKLKQNRFSSVPDIDDIEGEFDLVLILLPKNLVEAMGFIAKGLQCLKPGGMICVAGGNKTGGNRIAKHLQEFGIEDTQNETKNRARVVWANVDTYNETAVKRELGLYKPRNIIGGAFVSYPGIYGWDKIDKGSSLLLNHISAAEVKNVADFGCGYGYLCADASEKIRADMWHCIDADWRALEVAKTNMHAHGNDNCRYYWSDITADEPPVQGMDIILMNPPFHEGQKGDPEIGNAFIRSAFKALNKKGELWMVANNHLPYERALNEHFSSVEKLAEEQGFKVYKAVK